MTTLTGSAGELVTTDKSTNVLVSELSDSLGAGIELYIIWSVRFTIFNLPPTSSFKSFLDTYLVSTQRNNFPSCALLLLLLGTPLLLLRSLLNEVPLIVVVASATSLETRAVGILPPPATLNLVVGRASLSLDLLLLSLPLRLLLLLLLGSALHLLLLLTTLVTSELSVIALVLVSAGSAVLLILETLLSQLLLNTAATASASHSTLILVGVSAEISPSAVIIRLISSAPYITTGVH